MKSCSKRKRQWPWRLRMPSTWGPTGILLTPKAANAVLEINGTCSHQSLCWFAKWRHVCRLLTSEDGETHIPHVHEQVVSTKPLTLVNHRQFVIIVNPFVADTGKNLWGHRKLVRGDKSFFLQPGEHLEGGTKVLSPLVSFILIVSVAGIRSVYVLEENQALVVKALEAFEESTDDGTGKITTVKRKPGERWLVYGPREYWPSLEVCVEHEMKAFFRVEALKVNLFRADALITWMGVGLICLLLLFSFVF